MRYLSVCSGIEAATVAWHPLGWTAAAYSEIEPFPCALLAHHYPNTPNLGDMTRYQEWPDLGAVDLLVGGTPCQSFSVAGLRGGLADPRGSLMLTFGAIAGRYRPRWVVWENVPGVLSSGAGRDFGAFLGMLGELGYGFAYRVLDAQYCGVPQRRRRVFVVGHSGDWHPAAAVLFERASLSGHSAPGRAAREDVAGTIGGGSGNRGWSDDLDRCGAFIATAEGQQGASLTASNGAKGVNNQTPLVFDGAQITSATNRSRIEPGGVSPTVAAGGSLHVAHALTANGHDASEDGTGRGTPLVACAITGNPYGDNQGRESLLVPEASVVRRLTPRECERLQGFPDDYTLIPYRGKPACDAPRYKALGNSMAVPCMAWIGDRINRVEESMKGGRK